MLAIIVVIALALFFFPRQGWRVICRLAVPIVLVCVLAFVLAVASSASAVAPGHLLIAVVGYVAFSVYLIRRRQKRERMKERPPRQLRERVRLPPTRREVLP